MLSPAPSSRPRQALHGGLRRRAGDLLTAALAAGLLAGLVPGVASAGGEPVIPTISLGNQFPFEPDKGQTVAAPVYATLSSAAVGASVQWKLVSGTAIAGKDFVAASGTLVFDAGLSKPIPITIIGDNRDEHDETFVLKLSNPVNATLADVKRTIVIRDDDGPTLSVTSPTISERGPGQHPTLVFTLTLSKPGIETIKVTAKAVGGSLQAGSEVTVPAPKTFTFLPGQTVKRYKMPTTGDYANEYDEDISIQLSNPVDVMLMGSQFKGTVKDDDCTGSDQGADDAQSLTSVSGDAGPETRSLNSAIACNGEHDWYRVRVDEDILGIGDSTALTAIIRLNVADAPLQGGGDLDLCVYRRTIIDADTLIGCSTSSGVTDEIVEFHKSDSIISDDSTTLWIRVLNHGITQGPNSYTLKVFGDPT